MKHLLMISYFFPPHGGGGVLRPVQTARLLVGHGWRTTVVAGPEKGWWLKDESLLDGLPEEVDVLRARAPSGAGLLRAFRRKDTSCGRNERAIGLFRFLADWLGVADVYCGWVPFAAGRAMEVADKVDCILSTSPVESAHLAARRVARKTGKPWVADFRDPWVRGIYRRYPTGLHRRIQQRLERQVVTDADVVIANTEEALKDFRSRYSGLPGEKYICLPNGFDPGEFQSVRAVSKEPGPLRIIHAGGLTLDRDPGVIFEALAALKAENPQGVPCRLEFVGLCDRKFREKAARLGVEDLVEFSGVLPRSTLLERLAGADIGLVLESFREGAELVVPGKTYDYMGAGLEVLAVVPKGAASRLIRETGIGIAVVEKKAGPVLDALRELISGRESRGDQAGLVNKEALAQYERPRQVACLAELLNSVSTRVVTDKK
jgi:glycosyltransferase involved in cell wall biosynthesis